MKEVGFVWVVGVQQSSHEFYGVLHQQEIYWLQRAKQLWLRDGDGDTRFFNSFASNGKKKNRIRKMMKHDTGTWHYEKAHIQKAHIQDF